MSDVSVFNQQLVIQQITQRLKERHCRDIKAKGMKGLYPETEPVKDPGGSGEAIPDITTAIPSYVIAVRDGAGMEQDETASCFRTLSAYCLKTFRSFVVVAPLSEHERVRQRMKEIKIKPAHYIWV
ncbi:MAG TPA: hypothetical protein VNZ86_19225 [Bacteroidia bacterium]|jgi:hypothetical protein|nr:hypothetical protein [Bacteroidia bacterium]